MKLLSIFGGDVATRFEPARIRSHVATLPFSRSLLLVFLVGIVLPLLITTGYSGGVEVVFDILVGVGILVFFAGLVGGRILPEVSRPALLGFVVLSVSVILSRTDINSDPAQYICRGLGFGLLVLALARFMDSRRLRLIDHSERFIHSLFASFDDSVFMTDGDKILKVNGRAQESFENAREGMPVEPLLEQLGVDPCDDLVGRCLMGGIKVPYMVRDAESRPRFTMTCLPLANHAETRRAVLVKIADVTDEALAEERLRLLSRVVDSVHDAVLILDLEGRVTSMNLAALELTGASLEDALLRPLETVLDISNGETKIRLSQALDDQRSIDLNTQLTPRGRERFVILTLSPLRENDGRVIGFVLFVKDTTEQKRIEQRFIQAEKLNALGSMVGGFAHELNNPLTAVLGCAQLLESTLKNDPLHGHAQVIIHHGRRCQQIVESLIKFARFQPEKHGRADINEIVLSVVALMKYQLHLDNIDKRLELQPGLPEITADATQLQQVLINLIANACDELRKADVGQERRLTIATVDANEEVLVTISDNGPGISPEIRSRIFEPFFTTKKIGEGTGLGLSLAFHIVSAHGGRLEARNGPEGGAEFEIALPARGTKPEDGRQHASDSVHPEPGYRPVVA